jgi:hypothetical protein
MATNFGAAMARVAREGFQFVSAEEYQRRAAVCLTCPRYRLIHGLYHGCALCGCSRLKLHFATETCPERRWHAEDELSRP